MSASLILFCIIQIVVMDADDGRMLSMLNKYIYTIQIEYFAPALVAVEHSHVG